jgi:hypothetical protein
MRKTKKKALNSNNRSKFQKKHNKITRITSIRQISPMKTLARLSTLVRDKVRNLTLDFMKARGTLHKAAKVRQRVEVFQKMTRSIPDATNQVFHNFRNFQ